MSDGFRAVVIGASSGGVAALATVLGQLPAGFGLPVIVVLHVPEEGGTGYLPTLLGERCSLPVREASDKLPLAPGTVYLAPAGYHLLVERDGNSLSLSVDEPVHFARPAIDVLFESAATAFADGLVGVILTGANQDGSAGLKRIKELGGTAMVQNPASAAAEAMPRAAIAATAVDQVLGLTEIGRFLAAAGACSSPPTSDRRP